MAHAITTQVIMSGANNTIIKVNIKGDGSSGDLNKQVIFDQSAYNSNTTYNKLMEVQYCFNGFSGELFWDATTDVPLISLENDVAEDFEYWTEGGIPNNGGTGRTGDILLTTTGLAATTEDGYIIFYVKHREMPKTL